MSGMFREKDFDGFLNLPCTEGKGKSTHTFLVSEKNSTAASVDVHIFVSNISNLQGNAPLFQRVDSVLRDSFFVALGKETHKKREHQNKRK